jgi:hypothetical protein
MAGIDITTIKELLGNKTLTMMLTLPPPHKVNAVKILDNALNENPTIQKRGCKSWLRLTTPLVTY